MKKISRRGAQTVTDNLDRIATLFQNDFATLGVPQGYAQRFAYMCDMMSDTITRTASEAEVEAGDEDAEVASKKAAVSLTAEDETGLSVERGQNGFDANEIGDEVGGPLEIIEPPSEPWMDDHYTQYNFQELRTLQQDGALSDAAEGGEVITKNAKSLKAKVASTHSDLSIRVDVLKTLHAKITVSEVAEVSSLAGDIQKQVAGAGKVLDTLIYQQATNTLTPEVLEAASNTIRAISDQLPYLSRVVSGVDSSSPVARLEFKQMIEDDSIKNLVQLGAEIIAESVKSLKPEPVEKKATAVKQQPVKPQPVKAAVSKAPEAAKPKAASSSESDHGFNLFA